MTVRAVESVGASGGWRRVGDQAQGWGFDGELADLQGCFPPVCGKSEQVLAVVAVAGWWARAW
ncbi:hypothetical protein [Streptomyces xantholiticus]|uniref:Uncharacterized protein n=1 Tax=Streptomyces xantholiticus TaxID=68285 RepID=A0ABV1UWZ1_9ACTN